MTNLTNTTWLGTATCGDTMWKSLNWVVISSERTGGYYMTDSQELLEKSYNVFLPNVSKEHA